MKTSWRRVDRETHNEQFIEIEPLQVVVGTQGASPQSGSAGMALHKDFLDGRLHDLIREVFGPAVLSEVIAAVQKAHAHAPFVEYHAEVARLRAFLDLVRFDVSLRGLHHREDTEDGYRSYGNGGDYKTVLKSDSVTFVSNLDVQPHFTTIAVERDSGQRIITHLPHPTSHAIAFRDHFYTVMNSSLAIIGPDGEMVHDETVARRFGDKLRIVGVYRFRNIVCFSFHWLSNNYPDGILRVDDRGRPIARWEPQPGDSGYWSTTS